MKLIAYLAALLAAPLAAATVPVTPSTVVADVKAAQPGDVLQFRGDFGLLRVTGRTFDPPVIVDLSGATVKGIWLSSVSGMSFTGGTVTAGPNNYAVRVDKSKKIRLERMTLRDAARGIVAGDSQDLVIIHNVLTNLRTDGIDLAGVQRALVAFNRCSNFAPVYPDHPDCIQSWQTKDREALGLPVVSDIVVAYNTIDGAMQGIGFFDGPYERITMIGNRVRNTYPQGVALYGGVDSLVAYNDVASFVPNKPDGKPGSKTNVNVVAPVRVIACGNVMPNVPKSPAALPC